jgi:hypothetical protein
MPPEFFSREGSPKILVTSKGKDIPVTGHGGLLLAPMQAYTVYRYNLVSKSMFADALTLGFSPTIETYNALANMPLLTFDKFVSSHQLFARMHAS